MLYGPDDLDSEDEGLSDDNEYLEFKQRLKSQKLTNYHKNINTEEQLKKVQLQKIFSAVTTSSENILLAELDKGFDVNTIFDSGWTLLLVACSNGNLKIILELLNRGADINQNKDGITTLMLLCSAKSENEDNLIACLQLLIEKGADVNAVNRKRKTAFMYAAQSGYVKILKELLPLVNKHAEDNQRWTALFYAVSENKLEVVKLLLAEGLSCEKIDLHGDTVTNIAYNKGYEEILNVLPHDPTHDNIVYNNVYENFEDIFKDLKPQTKPLLFQDVFKILYGCKSESLMPLFINSGVGLFDILHLNEEKLKSINVGLPFQRRRILGGIYRFHKSCFLPKSVPYVPKKELYSTFDIAAVILSHVRHLIAMEASLKFILNYFESPGLGKDNKNLTNILHKNQALIRRLYAVSNALAKKAKKWDLTLKSPDKITRKRRNIPWANLCLTTTTVTISLMVFYKIKY